MCSAPGGAALAILAGHDPLVPEEIGYVGGIQRITLRLKTLQQGWDIRLFHEAEMGVGPPHPRGDLVDVNPVISRYVRDQLGDDGNDHNRTMQRSDVSEVPDHDRRNVPREARQENRRAGHARSVASGDPRHDITDRNLHFVRLS
jgi:hypothetical protein